MNKVTIEITDSGYTYTVELNNGTIAVQTHEATQGGSKSVGHLLEDNNAIPDELIAVISNASFEVDDIMRALSKIQ